VTKARFSPGTQAHEQKRVLARNTVVLQGTFVNNQFNIFQTSGGTHESFQGIAVLCCSADVFIAMKRALAALLLAMALAAMVSAQTVPGQLAFEAATVKPHGADPPDGYAMRGTCRGADSRTSASVSAIDSSGKMRLYPNDLNRAHRRR